MPDVCLPLQLGIVADDVLRGHSVRHQINDKRDSDSHPADTGTSSHDPGVERNPVEHTASLPAHGAFAWPGSDYLHLTVK